MYCQKNSPEQLVIRAVAETIENLVFEEVTLKEVLDKQSDRIYEDSWWVKIPVLKPASGDLYLVVRKDLMMGFTGVMLGLTTAAPAREQIIDSLGELHNTICGRFMAFYLPQNQAYLLGLPEIGEQCPAFPSDKNRVICCLAGDHEIFVIVPEHFWQAKS